MPKKKNKTFVLHDETINTYGFRMLTAGADLTEFIKNPVMLLNHDDWSFPIGRWENIRKEDGKILAEAVFDLKDERGAQAAQKVEDGFVRAASMGAWPPDEVSEDPEHLLPGQRRPTVTKWKARESSICTIGANHNSLVFYDKEGSVIDLNDESNFIKLSDRPFILTKRKPMKKEFYSLLKLQDGADEMSVQNAVQTLIDDNVRLTDANTGLAASEAALKSEVTALNAAKKAEQDAEAIALTDAAVLDGRFNADQKEFLLEMFDKDFAKAKTFLGKAPKTAGVVNRINQENRGDVKLYDGKSWDELDKANLLVTLKDSDLGLFKAKYLERFGVEYSN